MSIVDPHFTMPGADMPPQEFKDLKTQQGQINWLAQFAMKINNSFEGQWDATAESLPYTDDATVSVIPSEDGLTFNFGIPRGAPYDDQVAFAFDTVAQMQENADLLGDGMLVMTAGFYAAGDGGGALYRISESGSSNNMDLIACGSLIAHAMIDNANIYIKQLGARNGADNTAAIQRALDLVVSRGNVFFNVPNSIITSTLTLNRQFVSLIGTYNQPRLVTPNNITILQVNGQGAYLYGLLLGASTARSATEDNLIGLKAINTVSGNWFDVDIKVENCIFYCTCVGAEIFGKNAYFTGCTFTHTCRGVVAHRSFNGEVTSNPRGILVDNCIFHGSMPDSLISETDYTQFDKCGVYLDGVYNNAKLTNCVFNSTSKGYMLISHGGGGIQIANNVVERINCMMGICIIINAEAVNAITITNNDSECAQYTASVLPKKYPIILERCDNCFIGGNTLKYFYGLFKLINETVLPLIGNFAIVNKSSDDTQAVFEIDKQLILRAVGNAIASAANVHMNTSAYNINVSPLDTLMKGDSTTVKYTLNWFDGNISKENTNLI